MRDLSRVRHAAASQRMVRFDSKRGMFTLETICQDVGRAAGSRDGSVQSTVVVVAVICKANTPKGASIQALAAAATLEAALATNASLLLKST